MKNKIINGKAISEKILNKIKKDVKKMTDKPGLSAILCGDDPSSYLYVKLKKAACEKCDIPFHRYCFPENAEEKEILAAIDFLNTDPETTGILVQLPLPEKFNTEKIISAVDYRKDIDGFHPKNRANMKKCVYRLMPPLPLGIKELVDSTKEKIIGKNIVVLCNHRLFADPFFCLWGDNNEIKVANPKNKNWKSLVKNADLLIVAVGRPKLITTEIVKDNAIIIDVGINKVHDRVVGDVDFKDVLPKVKFISPVPGGVGPMTIALLLQNLIKLKNLKK